MPSFRIHPASSPLTRLAARLTHRQSAGVVVQDYAGRIVDHNPAAMRLLKMTSDQLLGRSSADPRWEAIDTDGTPLDPADHPAMEALRTGRPVVGRVLGVRDGSSDLRWLRAESWPIDDGSDPGVITQFTDITVEIQASSWIDLAMEELQRHALPGTLPAVGWLSADYRYESASNGLELGGDFVDAFAIDDDAVGFFLGDVCGHDLQSVSAMISATHTLRAAGRHVPCPTTVLEWLHHAMSARGDFLYCSAIYGRAEHRLSGETLISIANQGHPHGVVVRAGGRIELLPQSGSVLGIEDFYVASPVTEVLLEPGDHLVLYSDGLLDNLEPRRNPEELMAHLGVTASEGGSPMDAVDGFLRSAEATSRGRDDAAALVIAACSP